MFDWMHIGRIYHFLLYLDLEGEKDRLGQILSFLKSYYRY